jgi:hypothetical protein
VDYANYTLSVARYNLATTSVSNLALFGGGQWSISCQSQAAGCSFLAFFYLTLVVMFSCIAVAAAVLTVRLFVRLQPRWCCT